MPVLLHTPTLCRLFPGKPRAAEGGACPDEVPCTRSQHHPPSPVPTLRLHGLGHDPPTGSPPPSIRLPLLSHEMPRSTLEPPLLPLSGEKRPSKVSFTDGTQGQQRARGLGLEQDCGTRSACSVPSGGPGLRVGRGSPPPTPSPDWLGHRGPSAPRREAAEVPLQGGPRAGRRGKENDP